MYVIYSMARVTDRPSRVVVLWGATALLFYLFITFLQGRLGFSLSIDGIVEIFDQVVHRIFGSNQLGAVIGFRYVYDLPIVWGGEWLEALRGLGPNHS